MQRIHRQCRGGVQGDLKHRRAAGADIGAHVGDRSLGTQQRHIRIGDRETVSGVGGQGPLGRVGAANRDAAVIDKAADCRDRQPARRRDGALVGQLEVEQDRIGLGPGGQAAPGHGNIDDVHPIARLEPGRRIDHGRHVRVGGENMPRTIGLQGHGCDGQALPIVSRRCQSSSLGRIGRREHFDIRTAARGMGCDVRQSHCFGKAGTQQHVGWRTGNRDRGNRGIEHTAIRGLGHGIERGSDGTRRQSTAIGHIQRPTAAERGSADRTIRRHDVRAGKGM